MRLPVALTLTVILPLVLHCGSGSQGDTGQKPDVFDDPGDLPLVFDSVGEDVMDLPDLDDGPGLDDGFDADDGGCGGVFGCPCDLNEDCLSGVCILTTAGRICTEFCFEDCEDTGWPWICRLYTVTGEPLYVCLPRQPLLCIPCADDLDCDYPGFAPGENQCIAYGDELGSFCGGPCQDDEDCPGGYDCVDVDGVDQCVAADGDCQCSTLAFQYKMETACTVGNAAGVCPGKRRCLSKGALNPCDAAVPAAESCDAVDNDCDGDTDDVEELGQLTCGEGPCAHSVPACTDGKDNACDPFQGAQPEGCDGLDNDCDGEADEGSTDTDLDGAADCVDPDDDDDGVPDDGNGSGNPSDAHCLPGNQTNCDDNCPLVKNGGQDDQDLDGTGDACDPDRDGDGHASSDLGGGDCNDTNPAIHPGMLEGASHGDALCDGTDNDCDGNTDEGYGDADQDGQADCTDPDDDNDGVLDDGGGSGVVGDQPCVGGATTGCDDNCPKVANPDQADTDQDGLGNTCESDQDGDGWPDGVDNCPGTFNPTQVNSDDANDGGDACDTDDDNDGDPDESDCEPVNPDVSSLAVEACNGVDDDCDTQVDEGFPDSDGDKTADCQDVDDDDDGILDAKDNCPLAANFDQLDTDKDGQGDECDPDDDNDTIPDEVDNCPKVANPDVLNTDGDGQGNACDADDDNDGLDDGEDNCPVHANPLQEDFDGDLLGDPCDPDQDGDGVANDTDTCPCFDDKKDADGDGIPEECEIFFAGHVWPPNGSAGSIGSEFLVFIQLWKAGVTSVEGPAPGLEVTVRYRLVGDAQWQEGTAAFHKDLWFTDDEDYTGHNEEHVFQIPAGFTAGGGTLEVDFVPLDMTGGPDHAHPYNNGPIFDQGWQIGTSKTAAPFVYPLE